MSQGKFPVSIGTATLCDRDTPASVQAFLPSGGTSRQLVGRATNPWNIKNTMAGQTLTASLNYMQWNSLAGATLKSSPYEGKTVVEVDRLANQALGSGASMTVLSNLNTALDTINNNMIDRGALVCPSR